MKRLSRNFKKKSSTTSLKAAEENASNSGQTKISSFFTKPGLLSSIATNSQSPGFKTPEPVKKPVKDDEIIEKTPESDADGFARKRRLFKLKKQTSKVGRLFSSTTSMVSGNLSKTATEVQSPPESKEDFAKKRPLSPEIRNEG